MKYAQESGDEILKLKCGIALLVLAASGLLSGADTFPSFVDVAEKVGIGLGNASRVDRVQIRWPNGKVEELPPMDADRFVMIKER